MKQQARPEAVVWGRTGSERGWQPEKKKGRDGRWGMEMRINGCGVHVGIYRT